MVLIYLFLATLAVFVGAAIAVVSFNKARLSSIIVGFTAGAVLGILLLLAFHLYAEFGVLPLLVMVGGFLWMFLVERLTHHDEHHHHKEHLWGADLALVGLSVHALTDGINLVIAANDANLGVSLAIAIIAHRLPVATTLMLAYMEKNRTTIALLRLTPLAVAPLIGALIGEQVISGAFTDFTEYLTAFAGGTLLHILTHQRTHLEWSRESKVVGGVAFSLGIAIALLVMRWGH